MKKWLTCLFFGHLWELRHNEEQYPRERAYWEDYHVCARCGKDTRPAWGIQDDNEIRLERIAAEIRRRDL